MKTELANDPIMKEIHLIREKHYEESRNISSKEDIRRMNDRTEKFISSYGYRLIPTSRGTHKLVRAV